MTDNKDERGTLDLSLLIEQHKQEIWNYKMKESEWTRTYNQLEGNKKIIEELSSTVTELRRDNKYLAKQIEDYREILKKAGL
jgi:predicted RNase H-like nuclease (RuvC/YqgF family)